MVFPVQHEIASGKKRPRNDSLNSYCDFSLILDNYSAIAKTRVKVIARVVFPKHLLFQRANPAFGRLLTLRVRFAVVAQNALAMTYLNSAVLYQS
jgi:hypothetical protein